MYQTLANNSTSVEKEGEVHDFEMVGTEPTSPLMITAMPPFVRQMSPGLALVALEIGLLERASARTPPAGFTHESGICSEEAEGEGEGRNGDSESTFFTATED